MILADKVRTVEMSEGIVSSEFTIKSSKKAFDILVSGIYSDRTKATIRELATNAADANVQAGKPDEPITVHLPNTMEPFFFVRDNGTGMSHEKVLGLYSTLFDSDKTDRNDVTGCLGLGSKTPFAYTDQFMVESRHDGTKSSYSCYVNEKGVPTLARLAHGPTDEPNGVEVRFAVERVDFKEFADKAADVLQWFSPRPVVTGNGSFEFPKIEYLRKTDKYGLRTKPEYGGGESNVVMGNVAYRLNVRDMVGSKITLSAIERRLIEWGTDLFFPIGTVDIAASREKISYDDRSIQAIKDCLADAVKEISDEIEATISSAPTLWAAMRAFSDCRHNILGEVRNLVNIKWHGKTLSDTIDTEKFIPQAFRNPADGAPIQVASAADPAKTVNKYIPPGLETARLHGKVVKRSVSRSLQANGTFIYLIDMERGGQTRVLNNIREKQRGYTDYYILTNVEPEFLTETGLDKVVIRASTLPKVAPTKNNNMGVRVKSEYAKLYEYTFGGHAPQSYWKPAEVELNKGGVYVEIAYFRYKALKAVDGENMLHPKNLSGIYSNLQALGVDQPIYGIRPGDVKGLAKYGNWVSLGEYLDKFVAEKKKKFQAAVRSVIQLKHLRSADLNLVEFLENAKHKFAANTPFGKFAKLVKEASAAGEDEKIGAFLKLCGMLAFEVVTEEEKVELKEMGDDILSMYPILDLIDWYGGDDKLYKAIKQYVDVLDAGQMAEAA